VASMRPRVWIDDPHPIFRRGLAATLSDTYRIVGESAELRPLPDGRAADVLMFDLTGASLRKTQPLTGEITLVALVQRRNAHLQVRALTSGVAGLLLRDGLSVDRVKHSIQAALSGQTSLPSDLVTGIIRSAAESVVDPERIGLVGRDLEVLRQLAAGGDTRSIASEMSYSERTVKNMVHDLLIKMNCRNRAHAVATATRQGLI
jgi:DNA-binding NarL/FixJ family response regulator